MLRSRIYLCLLGILLLSGCHKHNEVAGGDIDSPVFTSINVDNITSGSARINWVVSEDCSMTVDYGTSTVFGAEIERTSAAISGNVDLTGLSEGATYYYQLTAKDSAANITVSSSNSFHTIMTSGSVCSVQPQNAALHFGESVTINATATDSDNYNHNADVQWTLENAQLTGPSDPAIGSINTNSGGTVVFTAGNMASRVYLEALYMPTGKAVGVKATVRIDVTP